MIYHSCPTGKSLSQIILFLFFVQVWICPINTSAQKIQSVKILTGIKPTRISDIFNISRYVKLETNAANLVSHIRSLQIRNDTIFAFASQKVLLWKIGGNYLGSIGKTGKGQGEMILPSDFALSPQGNKLGIWDNGLRCLFLFDLSGKFIRKVNPGFIQITNFTWTKTNHLILYSQFSSQKGRYFSLYQTDLNGKETNTFLPFNPMNENLGFLNYYHFPSTDKKQYVWVDFDQTIYELGKTSVNPFIKYEFEKGNFTANDILKFKGDTRKLDEYMTKNEICIFLSFNDLLSFYTFTYILRGNKYTNIISSNGATQYKIQHNPEGLDPLGIFSPSIAYKDELICIVEPYLLKSKLKQALPQVKQSMGAMGILLEKIAKDAKDEDNPILIFLKYKGPK